jgi:hypothetical protein
MKIGVIADTHDNLPFIKKAVEIFNKENVELLIHAGDYVAPFTFNEFKNINCRLVGVFGNNDGDKKLLREKYNQIGELKYPPHTLILGNKRILILHDPIDLQRHLQYKIHDVIIYGHTHQPEVRKEGGVVILNPGECGGWLSGNYTILLLDTELLEATIIKL